MPSEKRQRQKEREQAARAARQADAEKRQRRKTYLTIGGLVVLVIALAAIYSVVAGDDDDSGEQVTSDTTFAEETTTTTIDPTLQAPCPAEDGSSEQMLEFEAPQQDCLVAGAVYEAVYDTTAGEIRVALDTDTTPDTVNNFVVLSRYHYYDGSELFRTNTGIDIIQGGSPHTNDGQDPGPGYTIPDEGGPYTYEPGDLVMARSAAPNSGSAQFFFSTGPNTALLDDQGTYVVFGHVTEGMDIVEAIMASHVDTDEETGEGAPDPVPVVNSITIVQT